MTKAERKEQARRERLELIRKQAQSRRRRRIGIIVGSILAAGAIAAAVVAGSSGGGSKKNGPVDPRSLPGILTSQATAAHPWAANSDEALSRADELGFPAVGNVFHHHDLLQIFVHGDPMPVPADVGIDSTGSLAAMHTHDTSGIMHIESNRAFDFTLGDFFDIWGVLLTNRCMGGYCAAGPDQLRVYVNGKQVTTDVTKIALTQHEDVVVTYGTTAQVPDPIPSSYSPDISSSCKGSC
jgi:hypothetical protein